MKKDLQDAYSNLHDLNRKERFFLRNELLNQPPDFYNKMLPKSQFRFGCEVRVLLVADGALNFGIGDFGLSEFVTTFSELQQNSLYNIRYRVTLAHRRTPSGADMLESNTFITNRITGFHFTRSVHLNDFDQVWLFGIESSNGIDADEINAIEDYMDKGGGLFATGDHGTLGSALSGQIPRVKDMRLWADTDLDDNLDEVSMIGRMRNDTNRPGEGQTVSNRFANQSDQIPQQIGVRTFGSFGMGFPHQLLSISRSKRATGIIDIMPDHPHEGQCGEEKVFIVTNPVTHTPQAVKSQIIATSFVLGGSTAAGKDATNPHCFPSIAVFDGRIANVGRIVVDSTWHHFVNINLVGDGVLNGLNDNDFAVIQQYYKNISSWISRRKVMYCKFKSLYINLLQKTQIVEASLNRPTKSLKDILLSELYSIGSLANEILSENFTPAFAYEFICNSVEPGFENLSDYLNIWKPVIEDNTILKRAYHQQWINYDIIVYTAVGAGFIALRDYLINFGEDMPKDVFDKVDTVFYEGAEYGATLAIKNLVSEFNATKVLFNGKK